VFVFFCYCMYLSAMGQQKAKYPLTAPDTDPSSYLYQSISNDVQVVYFETNSLLTKLENISSLETLVTKQSNTSSDFFIISSNDISDNCNSNQSITSLTNKTVNKTSTVYDSKDTLFILYKFDSMLFIPVTWIKTFDPKSVYTTMDDPPATNSIPTKEYPELSRLLQMNAFHQHVFIYNEHLRSVDRYSKEGYLNVIPTIKNGKITFYYTTHHFSSARCLIDTLNSPYTRFYYFPNTNKVSSVTTVVKSFLPKTIRNMLIENKQTNL